MKHFETLHRELMALLETSPELSDGQILELIDGLLVDSETGRCLSPVSYTHLTLPTKA